MILYNINGMCQNVIYYTFWMKVIFALWVVSVSLGCLFFTSLICLYTATHDPISQIFRSSTKQHYSLIFHWFKSLRRFYLEICCPIVLCKGDCCLIHCLSIFADAAAAEEPGPGGRNGAGTAGWGSGCADQLHWPNHHANRETHLPHEETAVALTVQPASLCVLLGP